MIEVLLPLKPVSECVALISKLSNQKCHLMKRISAVHGIFTNHDDKQWSLTAENFLELFPKKIQIKLLLRVLGVLAALHGLPEEPT